MVISNLLSPPTDALTGPRYQPPRRLIARRRLNFLWLSKIGGLLLAHHQLVLSQQGVSPVGVFFSIRLPATTGLAPVGR